MVRNIYGLDLGTYEIKVFDKKKEKIWTQKDVIAVKDEKYIFSVGDEAFEMFEKTPDNIKVVFPMQNGVIAHFDNMQYLLENLLKNENPFMRGSEYLIAVPTDVTEVEKRAFYDLVFHSTAKAKAVRIVERGIADAIGAGVDVWNAKGVFIANFGGGTTELSVLSVGGMVLNRLLKIGGEHFDLAITNLVRRNHDLMIGRVTAEMLRRQFGVFEQETKASLAVCGRNLVTGIPLQKDIPIGLVRAAIKEPLDECVKAIQTMVDRTPPNVRRGILANGIYLTGGIANISGFAAYLEARTGLPVTMNKRPELCAVKGLRKMILNKEFRKLTYSMLDEDYRWLR